MYREAGRVSVRIPGLKYTAAILMQGSSQTHAVATSKARGPRPQVVRMQDWLQASIIVARESEKRHSSQ